MKQDLTSNRQNVYYLELYFRTFAGIVNSTEYGLGDYIGSQMHF